MDRVLIVEDEPLLRNVYEMILQNLYEQGKINQFISYQCSGYAEAVVKTQELVKSNLRPILCILDYRLKNTKNNEKNGIDVGRLIRENFPKCKIMIITSISDLHLYHFIIKTFKPSGFLIKADIDYHSTAEDILSVLSGNQVYSPTINRFTKDNPYLKYDLDSKDIELINLLLKRNTLPEIASKMNMSVSGIEYKKRRIAIKLGADSFSVRDLLRTYNNEFGQSDAFKKNQC